MSLPDDDSGMMNGLCEAQFEHLSLQSSLQEIFDSKTQDVIELHPAFVEDTDSDQSSEKCVSLKKATRVLLGQRQQSSGSLTDLCKGVLHPPNFTFVTEAIFSDEFQLLIQAGLLEGPPWRHVSFGVHGLDHDFKMGLKERTWWRRNRWSACWGTGTSQNENEI